MTLVKTTNKKKSFAAQPELAADHQVAESESGDTVLRFRRK
jgi:hypothetical protein